MPALAESMTGILCKMFPEAGLELAHLLQTRDFSSLGFKIALFRAGIVTIIVMTNQDKP